MQIEVDDLTDDEYTYLIFLFDGLFALIKENEIITYHDIVEAINGNIGKLGRMLLRTIMERHAENLPYTFCDAPYRLDNLSHT